MASGGDIKILDKLYINQNIICLALSYLGIHFADDDCLKQMCWFLLIFSLISVICSICIYTIEYGYKKWYKAQEYEIDYINKRDGKTNIESKNQENKTNTYCPRCPLNKEL